MARKPTYAPLMVLLNGQEVGRLRREASGAVDFQYADAWLAREDALPVSLSLPLREERYVGAPVLAVFDNLLPDNVEIRTQIAARVNAGGADVYSLLAAIGRDCVGALQFVPEGELVAFADGVAGEPLRDGEIAAIMRNLARAPLGMSRDAAFRISLAGAQEKTALLYHQGKWARPLGQTPTTHILKPQIGKTSSGMDLSQSVENEHFCLEVLRALGLPTTESQVLDFEDVRVLSVTRFDRQWRNNNQLMRVPQEDMCQALGEPSTRKYESDQGPGIGAIIGLLQGSDAPFEDQDALLRAQYVYWLLGATDGHAKNFSVFLSAGGGFQLTPLYDVMSLQPSVDANEVLWSQFRMAMAVGASRHYRVDKIVPRHFVESAEIAGVARKRAIALFENVRNAILGAITKAHHATATKVPPELADCIEAGVRKRARLDFEVK